MTKCIMVQGTMSGVGKSLLTAALCRIFHQDGHRVAPFKSQNMALNSYITREGLEMGRAQVVQALAAGREPDVRMNPILLKPSSDVGSQLIVHGQVRGDYRAADYFKQKKSLIPEIMAAYHSLCRENDIIVIEGAGSPAEINLKEDDIVNMGLAKLVDAPVLLVGDIDRGGVFAQLYGTLALLEPQERARVVGCVINKFRGDVTLLEPGLAMLEEKTHVPVLGVVPYAQVDIDDEDSLAPCLEQTACHKPVDIAVIRLPRLSNFTDFSPLEHHEALGVRYVRQARELGRPDLVILPGTKNTMEDLLWLRQNGLETAVKHLAASGTPVLGICGGYQMLGQTLDDPQGVERRGTLAGLGLLPCRTVFTPKKTRTRVEGVVEAVPFSGARLEGYEIHMGRTEVAGEPFCRLSQGQPDGAVQGEVFGTYLHGLFDAGELTDRLAQWLLARKGMEGTAVGAESHRDHQERQLDRLAEIVRQSLDLPAIYTAMERSQKRRGEHDADPQQAR
ncbi:MAG: cobyric acid synthase [Clostridiales bacterium]|nr:cobyric acid synthase [Clostridiales bacterium]MDY4171326.1 cobyric acid synthase [Evtepia sp.]